MWSLRTLNFCGEDMKRKEGLCTRMRFLLRVVLSSGPLGSISPQTGLYGECSSIQLMGWQHGHLVACHLMNRVNFIYRVIAKALCSRAHLFMNIKNFAEWSVKYYGLSILLSQISVSGGRGVLERCFWKQSVWYRRIKRDEKFSLLHKKAT